MNTPVIPRKPLPEPAQAYFNDSNDSAATFGSQWAAPSPPGQQMKDVNTVTTLPREIPSPDDKPVYSGRRHGLGCGIFAGMKTSTFGSTLSRHFNNFLPPHQRYFNNYINRRTLLIMIGITFVSVLALIIGLAAGLSIGSNNNALPPPKGAQTTGEMTFYNPALGACGTNHGDGDAVMAISHVIWDENQVGPNPNTNPLCGKKIRAHRVDERTGKDASIMVTIVDRCVGCDRNNIDVSPAMFDKLADKAKGGRRYAISNPIPVNESTTPISAEFPAPASKFEKELPSTPETLCPNISPLNFSEDKTFDQDKHIGSGLPQHSSAEKVEDKTDKKRSEYVSSAYSELVFGHKDLCKDSFSAFKQGPYSTLPRTPASETKENSAGLGVIEVPLKPSALEGYREMTGKSYKQKVSDSKRDSTWYCTLCWLTILTLVVGILAALSHAKSASLEKEVKGMRASKTLSLSSALPSLESSTLRRATSIEPQLESNSASVILLTSFLETSETPIPSPTPTSTLKPSSVRPSRSSTSSSLQTSSFLQTVDIDGNLVRRSGYLVRHEYAPPGDILTLHSDLDRRKDSGDREDTTTTTTTTLTTTITSTLRTSEPVVSSARSNFASSQLLEPKPTKAGSECMTNTVIYTASLSTSVLSYEMNFPSTITSSATVDSTLSPDTTPSPTTSPAVETLREDTAVVSASSSAIARRLVAPLAWKNLHNLRRFFPLVGEYKIETQQTRHLAPSITVRPITTTTHPAQINNAGTTAQLIGIASSNAAARRQAYHWIATGGSTSALPSKTHERRQSPSRSRFLLDAGTGTMSGRPLVRLPSSVPPTSSKKPTVCTAVKSKTSSSGTVSSIPTISLQQNALANTNPGSAIPPTVPVSTSVRTFPISSTSMLYSVSVSPSPLKPGVPPTSATAAPGSEIGVLPEHPSRTPPSEWTISMLTYSTQAARYTNLRTMPSNAAGTPPVYTGPHLAKDWPNLFPFPIPTGYVAPNIVPADPQAGQLTYFNPGLGACGSPRMTSNELAVAISWELFDMGREIGGSSLEEGWKSDGMNPDGKLGDSIDRSSSALCNQGIRAWIGDESGERLVEQEFVVRDRCEGCNVSDLDIQPDVYSKHWDGMGKGRIQVTWEWMQEAPTGVPG
ncbi:unnamed protein product [Alternaria burnsii]|nr:unnamed protein product [Alternaria burnsii]